MSTYTVKHLCSYCGGWEQIKQNNLTDDLANLNTNSRHSSVKIDMPDFSLCRDVCVKCLVKVFDVVLGEPKK